MVARCGRLDLVGMSSVDIKEGIKHLPNDEAMMPFAANNEGLAIDASWGEEIEVAEEAFEDASEAPLENNDRHFVDYDFWLSDMPMDGHFVDESGVERGPVLRVRQ